MMGTYGKVRNEIVSTQKVQTTLDLCCGTGYITGHINAERVFALDLSSGMLTVNRGKNKEKKNINIVVGDAFKLPFSDSSFDSVYNTLAAHEFKNISNILKEAHRVLRSGGQLTLYDFSYPENILLRYTYLPFLKHIVELGAFFLYDSKRWEEIFDEIGFKEIQTKTLYKASILIRARK
jgi:demethylmenaquinone methyltransferase/2-methoxy-6-polyprenyl-1,4-benzoquinol methylase